MSSVQNIAKALIYAESVTPHVGAAFDVLEEYLKPLGFRIERVVMGEGAEATENLYARWGTAAPNLCFAGHLDVVPPGDVTKWRFDPFTPTEAGGKLYGRGAEDMKGAIASFVAACYAFFGGAGTQERASALSSSHRGGQQTAAGDNQLKGSISFLITGDEEGDGTYGTRPMLNWLAERGEKIDACIVGEPTNPHQLGEMIKVGRRGSLNAQLTVFGKQGHVAYPHLADNPITKMLTVLSALNNAELDEGSEFFPPSNLEITSIDVGNTTSNLIPAQVQARFNVRFNDRHGGASLTEKLQEICAAHLPEAAFELQCHVSGESFLTENKTLSGALVRAVEAVCGRTPELSTSGGTSDARFIKDICPVVEFGTTGETAHHIDECVEITCLEKLSDIYLRFINNYLLG